ncbi:MAG: magnesium transporter, partial [Flavobacteriales bacterium]
MPLEISKALIKDIELLIENQNDAAILEMLSEEHHADIAEILDDLNLDEATYIIKLLDSEKTSDILMEIDEDIREKILKNLSAKEIAEEIEELDSDDAADIIAELSEERQKKVIS